MTKTTPSHELRHGPNGRGTERRGERSTEDIARELETTRRDIARTLRELEQRLAPGELFQQAVDYFRRTGAPEFTQNLGRGVRDNPMPVVLSAVGLGWLMWSSQRPPRSTQESVGSGQGVASSAKETGRSTLGAATDTGRRALERASEARSAASERGAALAERARGATDGARQRAQRARSEARRMMSDQPLAVGIAAFALASLTAALLPATETEDEMMGEARDRAMRKAAETGIEKGSRSVERAADKAQESTREAAASVRQHAESAPPF
jgi:hypothetical protein